MATSSEQQLWQQRGEERALPRFEALRTLLGNMRTVAWRSFGLMNTVLLQLSGYQASVRAGGRMYSVHTPTWPTTGWMGRELKRQGFVMPPGGFQVNRLPVVFHALRAG